MAPAFDPRKQRRRKPHSRHHATHRPQRSANPPRQFQLLEDRLMLAIDSLVSQPLPTGQQPIDVELGRINSDGNIDLAALGADGSLTIALNGGNNSWSSVQTTDHGFGPSNGMALGLFDRDPFLDLAVQGPNGITIARGDGAGNFTTVQTLAPDAAGQLAPSNGGRVRMATLFDSQLRNDLVTVSARLADRRTPQRRRRRWKASM